MSDSALEINITLLRDVFDLKIETEIPVRGITAIFGPSGAGKSSLLRAIAGFETPQSGRIALGNHVLFDHNEKINVLPHKRGVGYMFQDARLFSHLDVKGNLEFAHKRAPEHTREGGGASFDDVVSAFDVGALLSKNIKTLSGGEQQRVALARTVLSRPSLLLLDEPLAALDEARKGELMPFIRTLADDFDMAVIFVSHNVKEVGTLADRILCLDDGRLTASGPALSILPKLQTGAEMQHDLASWYNAKVARCDSELHAAAVSLSAAHELILPLTPSMRAGDICRLFIRADDVSIALTPPQDISIQNRLDARVKSVTRDGSRVRVQLYLPDVDSVLPDLYAFITPLAQAELKLKAGQTVTALVKSVSLSR